MNNLSDIFTEHKKSVAAFIDGVRDAAYQQGRADEQAFVEKRCKELGIDYIQIYTCNSEE